MTAGQTLHYNGVDMMRSLVATAPVRICDCGGWTDTWFAGHGAVFHIAVEPGVRVRADVARANGAARAGCVTLEAASFGDRYTFEPGTRPWVRHPLLEAAVESVGIPTDLHVSITVESAVPPGASTGTSAAVCVALIGALRAVRGEAIEPGAIAAAAHVVETGRLGQQSGVQDQLAAAYGGINFVEIPAYPAARVRRVAVPASARAALAHQLRLVFLGRTHQSSTVHEAVVRDVRDVGPSHPAIVALRQAAADARDAAQAGDLPRLGAAMRANTEAQRRLHPSLVGADAARVIEAAAAHGALGWKVNGAGGEGGSLTLLTSGDGERDLALDRAVAAADASYRIIPIRLAAEGVAVRAR